MMTSQLMNQNCNLPCWHGLDHDCEWSVQLRLTADMTGASFLSQLPGGRRAPRVSRGRIHDRRGSLTGLAGLEEVMRREAGFIISPTPYSMDTCINKVGRLFGCMGWSVRRFVGGGGLEEGIGRRVCGSK